MEKHPSGPPPCLSLLHFHYCQTELGCYVCQTSSVQRHPRSPVSRHDLSGCQTERKRKLNMNSNIMHQNVKDSQANEL